MRSIAGSSLTSTTFRVGIDVASTGVYDSHDKLILWSKIPWASLCFPKLKYVCWAKLMGVGFPSFSLDVMLTRRVTPFPVSLLAVSEYTTSLKTVPGYPWSPSGLNKLHLTPWVEMPSVFETSTISVSHTQRLNPCIPPWRWLGSLLIASE